MGVGELPVQPGLADPGLADHRDDLPAPGLGSLQGLAELIDLAVAADEAGQSPRGRGVQPRPDRARPDHLVDLDRFGQAPHRDRPPGHDLEVALREMQRRRSHQDGAGGGQLLHSRRQVCRLAQRDIVHVQVGVDGPDHDLSRVESDPDLH